jgi:hypothetical protein
MENKKIDFKELLKAIQLIRELEKIPLKKLAAQYAEFSKQEISEDLVLSWLYSGLGNEFFLTSDFLQLNGLKSLQDVVE